MPLDTTWLATVPGSGISPEFLDRDNAALR